MIEAIPRCKIFGCYFYWEQAIVGQIQSKSYSISIHLFSLNWRENKEILSYLMNFFCLSMLSLYYIEDANALKKREEILSEIDNLYHCKSIEDYLTKLPTSINFITAISPTIANYLNKTWLSDDAM
jgi:hypothetical protein